MNGQVSEQKARMLRGEPFCFVDPEILADFERCQDLLSALAAAAPAERQPILTELLDKVGEGTTVRPPAQEAIDGTRRSAASVQPS